MLQPFFDFIEKFATDFSWKRLVIFFSLLLLVGFSYFFYESQTSTSQLTKYERTVGILERLSKVDTGRHEEKEIINNIYNGLSSITDNSSLLSVDISIRQEIKQAVAGGAVWLLFALFFVPGLINKTNPDAENILGGCLAVAFITGLGGYFLPVTWSDWIVFGLYPVGVNLLLFIIFSRIGNNDSDE